MIASAKVNLALHVTGRRADGYHLLDTLVAFSSDGDLLEAEDGSEDDFFVSGHFAAHVPIGETNLVTRARDLLREKFGEAARAPVHLHLEKNLPVASGIGGGSADAAAALRLLVRHWQIDIDEATLARLGLSLGADVPMCLASKPLVARGIGEALEELPHFPALPLVLVNPNIPLSTPEVFSRLERRENPPLSPLGAFTDTVSAAHWLKEARNDLEKPACQIVPQIEEARDALKEANALFARMSGSGATCFGVFSTRPGADQAAALLQERHPDWFVLATETRSPVPTQAENAHVQHARA
ncbi:4-(cytidine 5'-diphospho)-2-C-methyl-D-erythritol kinase [Nitratireductor kimnyeongensis]|uniref:4-diphosphocytidyl-2-C-methyl-D-erythritol kinase n=1 Tax=Nitratireductor kimnyeongensis TaxID=430679 RepID=A0ABW0T5N0_9HYPH|nr:4-(cytidine 5'-diphospho)-2-C-methyl-D-erythritol kinase [Nitratireductor kimnyeongensis]QZZ34879.1 4-(cytidine 5'-diphospho)-2-C-methyl-D-erythritol kinase [Nitratireductor kimnyeongensis]